ncbi:transcription-repair coupling factor (superfamily II helicase) [Arcanobacterium wilhelmae]|uniref:Transcription-repair-coupling factor n=1 Tax=Arcanobacterium wilhelmae TaxID=1803177 RepID=A0ABT9NBX8_9ACTO|nr:transcription-repair coupling factor [Arcanobacterium wilhelmae]MDP9801221.1 transcription-repair coupling factor (superfamily II helicase) [Arcanobacterium wilhelmae]WFN90570.1 transcription-repair coupling factor [Arcanobacterium wilhelmae]
MDLRPILPLIDSGELASVAAQKAIDIAAPRGAAVPILASVATPDRLEVIVTASGRDADELARALRAFAPAEAIDVFPAWETLPHERLSPRSDTVANRLRVLRRLAHPSEFSPLQYLLIPIRSLLQPIAPGLGDLEPVRVRGGDFADMEELTKALVAAAYSRVDMVESRGEFAVRGDILDIFPPTEQHPLRVEFFGDEVEEIRQFSVADQRSMDGVDELYAPPCRELLITSDVRERALAAIPQLPGATDMLERIANGIAVEGMESLAPILLERLVPVVSQLPPASRITLVEPERIAARAESLIETTQEFLAAAWTSAAAGGEVPIQVDAASFSTIEDTRARATKAGHAWWTLGGFATDSSVTLGMREPQKFAGKVDDAVAALGALARENYTLVLTVEGAGLARRLLDVMSDAEVPARTADHLDTPPASGVVHIVTAPIATGFINEKTRLAVVGAQDLLGRVRGSGAEARKMPKRRKNAVDPLALKPGDYVVHERHGVAQFVKMAKRSLGGPGGTQREYVVLEYASSKRGAPRDQLWVPTDQLDQVTRYAGGDSPSLNKMGGADWAKTKAKAKAAIRTIAKELVRLYAQRRATKGHAFAPDTPWQRELEDAFEFVETPDQLSTIEDVKRDMESPEPMDRLISGDVGYGKTEIAIRAAFKAVQDGMQVAVLVPTTLLVQQHLETFEERYAGFPVKVAGLSRFQSEKESEEIKDGIRNGKIDVVVGTHRLITGDVRFKNLGLVVIDEEQRFGVEHKEALKQLYPSVDVLSMSATPIPRTLEMAVTGLRQMSQLATPPEERHPILTYVGREENKQIAAAIKRELLRDGQVFFIHNRTSTINKKAAQLAELVPEARVGVAHGKMSEHQLESVIQQFWDKEIDVLVCTTIVETGLDIQNANTLIVEDAQKLGLSQLHQLRGRVGRGRERAYAYFLYPPDKAMTETAIERLRTIAQHTELGAGFQVALKDLEIRGAGNLLGGEQSGHIAGVGFDLYLRMVGEAVAEITGQAPKEEASARDVRIELPVDAYVPTEWISSERLRLEAYQKIAAARGDSQRADVRAELVDRYGELPATAERLFAIARLRDLARSVGLEEITVMGWNVRFAPVQLPDSRQARLKRLYPRALSKPATRVLLVPLPDDCGARLGAQVAVENEEIVEFVRTVISQILVAGSEA